MYQNNFKCALSPMGTSLSSNQIYKLWNLVDVPFVCFDGDKAGQESSKKIALKILDFFLQENHSSLLFYLLSMILIVFLIRTIMRILNL